MAEELKTIETVDTSPFKHLVMTLGELPTSFVDSMTYYECLAWLVNFIQNTVIPTVNNNAEAVEELQTAFVTLKNFVDNYFDNLDVQDEINNKLDEMAQDGTLDSIINNNSIRVIKLGINDDIQEALNIDAPKLIILPKNETIVLHDALLLNSDTEIDLNGSTVFFDYARPASFPLIDWDETLGFMGYNPTSTFTQYKGYKNITIRNGVIKGGCSCFMHNTNILFEDIEFTTILSRHAIQFAGCYGVTIRRCVFNGTKHQEGVEHSSECINLDPCEYGGQPYVTETSPIYDHSANRYFRIESNTFKATDADGQLYGSAIGSHSEDSNGALLCENFVVTDNSFGSPYADTINVTDYNQVTISNNTVNFSTITHDTYTYFVHCRGGLKNITITNNIVNNVGQFIYTDRSTRDRKDLLIEGNSINAIDLSGYAVIYLSHYENSNVQHNTIKCQKRALHICGIYTDSVLQEGTESVNANFKYNEVTTTTSGSDVYLRFQDVQGCQIIGNVINYINSNNNASEYTLALQGTTSNAVVMHNRTSDPKHFVNVNSITTKFQYNEAQYKLSSASGTSQTGTLASPLTNFSKLKLQLGATTYTQTAEILPWLVHNRNKFYWGDDESRTYKFAVVTEAGQLGVGSLTINNDNTYSYTGDVTLRGIYAYD